MEARHPSQMVQALPAQYRPSQGAAIVAPQAPTSRAEEAAAAVIKELHELREALKASDDLGEQRRVSNNDMMRENAELREKLKAAEARVLFLQGYSVEITANLDNIGTLIKTTLERAQKSGIAAVKPPIVVAGQITAPDEAEFKAHGHVTYAEPDKMPASPFRR